MIADHQADTVYVADLLSVRHPQIEHAIRAALAHRLRIIPGTKDIWCRDFMPVQLDRDKFVQFQYDPDYLKDHATLRTSDGASLLNIPNCTRSNLVIDGGNVVRWHDAAIMTDKIYRENPGIERQRLRGELHDLLEVDRLIVIPKEPYDKIGHADGMVRFVNERTLLVNDYRDIDPSFGNRLASALQAFELFLIPYCPTGAVIDGIDSAQGVYVNFLQVCGTILFPIYGQKRDDEVATLLGRAFPQDQLIPIPATVLSREGGVLNCMTWNIQTTADYSAESRGNL